MIIRDSKISALIDLPDVFRMETHAYTKVLPMLGSFGPRCVYADKDTIIMEDLAAKGYANCERRNFLDMDHSVLALKVKIFQLIIWFQNIHYFILTRYVENG